MDKTELEKELQIYDECFDILLSQNKVSAWIYDIQKKEIRLIGNLFKFNKQHEPIQNVPWSLIESGMIHPDSENEFMNMFNRFSEGDLRTEAVIRMRSQLNDLGYQWKKININSRLEKDGSRKYAIVICYDILPQMDAKDQYLKDEMLQSVMMENVVAASKVNMTRNQVQFIWSAYKDDEQISRINNYDQMFHLGIKGIVNENDKQKYIRIFSYDSIMEEYKKGVETFSLEYHYKNPRGNISWALAYANLFYDTQTGDVMFYSFIRDIDEKKKMELTLEERAEHDSVTGLYNRQTAEAIIKEYIRKYHNKDKKYAAIVIDIDGFQYIRENYGYAYSDSILSGIGNILNTIFGNRIVAGRMETSEFLVFVEEISSENWVRSKIEEFCKVVHDILCPKNQEFWVSVSVGITCTSDKFTQYETMIEQAKQALYVARSMGKNQYAFYSENKSEEENCKSVCLAKDYLNKSCMMDEVEEMIFLIDEEDYSLIYMNKPAKNSFGIKNSEFYGKKCYEVIQGYSEPCPFCKDHIPVKEKYQVWKNVNDKLKQSFIVKDKMMVWNGRNVRYEIFTGMKYLGSLDMDNTMENLLLASIRILMISESLKTAINYILRNIGEFYDADRSYILEIDTKTKLASVTYEWSKAEIQPKIVETKNLSIQHFKRWINSMDKNEILTLRDINDIKNEFPFEYEYLRDQNVTSMYNVPFGLEKDKIGFISLNNPNVHINDIIFLNSMSYIIAAEMRKRRMIKEEEYNKYHDQMTGLLNRQSYSIYMNELKMDSISSMGVLTANINGLKNFNKNLGHNYGDKLVVDIAKCLQKEFGMESVYRFSGDEFIVISQDISFDTFLTKIENVKNNANKIHKDCLSVGYSWASSDIDINRMMANADDFMKVAKKRHYELLKKDEEYDEKVLKNLFIAIDEKWFSAYLQPKALAENGVVKGAEALIRLIHPSYGIIMPGKFVPYLEKENMIRYLDFFIFEEVCKILEEWKEKGYDLYPISLNFSRSTISEENLIDEMNEISDKYNISRDLLEIEITESIGKIEKEVLSEICGRIVENGYRLSLDDFGAKYSNIAVLSLLELNTLKLDKSLIDDIYSNSRMRIIVSSLVQACAAIGVDIVAEGVETEEQLKILQGLGCKYIQGYLINKAVDVATFEEKYMN